MLNKSCHGTIFFLPCFLPLQGIEKIERVKNFIPLILGIGYNPCYFILKLDTDFKN
ncbi:MAG: hypothetical protein IJU40_06140 [Desulfovibrionaceae bacterium]|nr:hypothetical protein [Desulfovibrionaceae bacterium]